MSENTNTIAKAVTTRRCTCGCGEATSSAKTMYKPGHDARHAGNVARAIAEAVLNGTEAEVSLMDLPTANLVHKADAMSKRLVEKAAKKAERTATRKPSDKPAKPAGKIAEVVAAEEAAHAEETAAEVPEPMFGDEDGSYTRGTMKVGRWEYPTRTSRQAFIGQTGVHEVTERNEKRDGSGKWITVTA